MNLFGLHISRAPRASILDPRSSILAQKSLSPATWLRGEDLDLGGAVLSNAYEQVVWVYRAINVLADQVANIPFLFSAGERGRENLITSGPLLEFYNRPHPQMNRFQYWELRVIWLMLRGECMRIPIYNTTPRTTDPGPQTTDHVPRTTDYELQTTNSSSRTLSHILILDPARFQHLIADHRLIGWRYTGFGPKTPLESQVFLPEEVWFEKLPNPFDFWRGLSPLQTAAMAAKTDFAAGAFMKGLIENNADLGLIVRTPEQLSDEQQEQILAALRRRKRRAGTADQPLLLWSGAEVIKPTLSSGDLQFLENRKFSRAEICAAFGVPEEIVTTTDTAKYDVMAGARLNFIENRVAPLCSRLEAEEEATVRSIDPGAVGWFDLDSLPIMQQARRDRLSAARGAFEMGVPFNELNRVLDLGFRPLPWGHRGYVASKLQEVGREEKSKAANAKPTNPEGFLANPEGTRANPQSTPANPERVLIIQPRVARNELPWVGHPNKTSNPERVEPLNEITRADQFLSQLNRYQPSTINHQLLSKLRRFFFEQRCRVLARIDAALKPHDTAPSNAEAASTLQRFNALTLFDLPTENALLLTTLTPALTASLEAAAQAPATVQAHLSARGEALSQVNQATLAALEQTLADGQANSETPDQLTARVKAVYNAAAARLAPALAQTEAAAAIETVRHAAQVARIEDQAAAPGEDGR